MPAPSAGVSFLRFRVTRSQRRRRRLPPGQPRHRRHILPVPPLQWLCVLSELAHCPQYPVVQGRQPRFEIGDEALRDTSQIRKFLLCYTMLATCRSKGRNGGRGRMVCNRYVHDSDPRRWRPADFVRRLSCAGVHLSVDIISQFENILDSKPFPCYTLRHRAGNIFLYGLALIGKTSTASINR